MSRLLHRIASFLSHNVWAGVGGLIAVASIAITVNFFYVDREQKTANIEYWSFEFPVSVRLPSGEMSVPSSNTLLLGMRNNGPSVGEGVLVSVQAGDRVKCTEIGPGLGLAETQKPARVTTEPYLCEYYYEYLYPDYYLFFLIDPSSTNRYVAISITGKNVRVTDVSSEH